MFHEWLLEVQPSICSLPLAWVTHYANILFQSSTLHSVIDLWFKPSSQTWISNWCVIFSKSKSKQIKAIHWVPGFPCLGVLLQKLENPALRACLQVQSNEVLLQQLTQHRKHNAQVHLYFTWTHLYLFAFILGIVWYLCALVFVDLGISKRICIVALGFQNCVLDLLKRVKAEASWRRRWKLTDVNALYEDNRHEKDKALKNETSEAMNQYWEIVKNLN